jgi:hypothetical protein
MQVLQAICLMIYYSPEFNDIERTLVEEWQIKNSIINLSWKLLNLMKNTRIISSL